MSDKPLQFLDVGLHYDVPESVYHADPCATPSLSSSIAKVINEKSARHAFHEHPRMGGNRRNGTKAMDKGTIIHELMLGKGAGFVEVDAKTWASKNARERGEEIRAEGKTPVLAWQLAEYRMAADALLQMLRDRGIEFNGDSEVTVVWKTRGVLCRCRIDHIDADGMVLDLKTIESASPEKLARHIIAYGYDIQRAAYINAMNTLYPSMAGRVTMKFLFCETTPPYDVVVCSFAGTMRDLGQMKWDHAVDVWKKCLESGEWPGYSTEDVRVEAPAWAFDVMERG
jgi:hypothetical protein